MSENAERSARVRLLRSLGWDDFDPDLPVFMLGLVSVQAAGLLGAVEDLLGLAPPDDLLLTHPSINELARFVANDSILDKEDHPPHPPPTLDWQGEVFVHGQGYFIRRASLNDAADLAALDASSWPAPLCGFCEDEIRDRIQAFEAGQLVLCAPSGELVGSLYTQRVASADAMLFGAATFRDAHALHQDSGSVWQLLSVQVTPSLMSRGLGDVLINYALTVARASPGVHKVVAVTRCRTWAEAVRQQPTLTLEEHLEMGTDSGLVFHTARGADITALVPNWRPEDLDNGGVGVLIEYDLASFRLVHDKPPAAIKKMSTRLAGYPTASGNTFMPTCISGTCESAQAMQRVVRDVVHSFLKEDVSADTPLMGAGLDSYMMQHFVQASAQPTDRTCRE